MALAGGVLLQRWQLHRGALVELLDRMPESAGALRVWPGGRSTLELADHIAGEAEAYVAPAVGMLPGSRPGSPTLSAVRNRLTRQLTDLGRPLSHLDADALGRMVTVSRYRLSAPAGELVQLHIQHEAYHAGQLAYHARLLGIHPPFFLRNLWSFAAPENWPPTPKEE